MTESIDKSDIHAQINEVYKGIGRFIVEFSRIVRAMEGGLIAAAEGKQEVILAITAEMTADPLSKAWRSTLVHVGDLSDKDREVLKDLAKEIATIITLRNDWMHGSWFVGYGNETTEDWSKASLLRQKNSATGLAASKNLEAQPTASYIEKAATHASVLAGAISNFDIAFLRRRPVIGEMLKDARPSDRIRFVTENGHRRIQIANGSNWQSSEWG